MTPNNIAGMATLCELNIVALTDHNTCRNCPGFFKAAKKNGIIPIAGMELTTAEEIHVVCLFEELEDALAFDAEVENHIVKVQNRPDIFGKQNILNENDEEIGIVEHLLINATDITIDDVPELVARFNGICWPAHIDRPYNGIISMLGLMPDSPHFGVVELHDTDKLQELTADHPNLAGRMVVTGSDAHYLQDMRDKEAFFELEDEPFSSSLVRHNLFEMLKRAIGGKA